MHSIQSKNIVILSGPVAVGKSSFISELVKKIGGKRLSTRAIIQSLKTVPTERQALQTAGEELDEETDGKWVADALKELDQSSVENEVLIVDSVRIEKQISHLRKVFGDRLFHVYLDASDEVLKNRYSERFAEGDKKVSYAEVQSNATESNIGNLKNIADLSIVTDCIDAASAAILATSKMGHLPTKVERTVDVLVGGQFGSEGKGNICDFLANKYQVLMRVGGPNAGHKVAEPKYDYVHLPSGTMGNPEAQILIGAGTTLDVTRILKEIIDCNLSPERLSIDPNAVVIEQSDRDFENRLEAKISSTKKGVGVAAARKIVGRDGDAHFGAKVRLAKHVSELEPYVRDVAVELQNSYLAGHRILLEGTQGTDLSLHHGMYPYVTSRDTSASGCLAEAGISPMRVDRVFMVTRTYPIRVGGPSGDMGKELQFKDITERSGKNFDDITKTEVGTVSGKTRRIAEFSWDRIYRSAQLNGATDIVLTFADYLDVVNENASKFEDLSNKTQKFITDLENLTGCRVSIVAVGFGRDKIFEIGGRT